MGAGFIIDRRNNVSTQTDLIVYDALNCPIYRASEDAAIFFSDNVAAVVEVKSRLDKDQFVDAFERIKATKQLVKTPLPELPLPMTSQTVGCLFAFDSAISLETITDHYYAMVQKHGIGYHIDIILILDKGTITMWSRPRGFDIWGLHLHEGTGGLMSEGLGFALAIERFGNDSLDVPSLSADSPEPFSRTRGPSGFGIVIQSRLTPAQD